MSDKAMLNKKKKNVSSTKIFTSFFSNYAPSFIKIIPSIVCNRHLK